MPTALSYELHVLTARLDRAADVILQAEIPISYRRFLALFGITQGATSQRELAAWLAQSEPSTSRMVGVLSREGLLAVSRSPGAGNRRVLQLTSEGAAVVDRCSTLLEGRFEELVRRAGVPYARFQRDTRRLLNQIGAGESSGPERIA
ncbi:MAG TPA: MarR family winged helix-turn-helix transcriptional regulator [Mycobacteriales bacterium]|nr:MarR family winged helix-turn-helix transcriptional regulator [Mycobacteriales bacterium]